MTRGATLSVRGGGDARGLVTHGLRDATGPLGLRREGVGRLSAGRAGKLLGCGEKDWAEVGSGLRGEGEKGSWAKRVGLLGCLDWFWVELLWVCFPFSFLDSNYSQHKTI